MHAQADDPTPDHGAQLVVALDVTPLVGTRTGVGQAVAGLVDALTALDAPPVLAPFCASVRARGRGRARQLPAGTTALPLPAITLHRLWAVGDRPWADRWLDRSAGRPVDVVHGTNAVVPPVRRAASVVTIHDVAALTHPGVAPASAHRAIAVARRAIARGAWVHTPSTATAVDVRELLGAERVAVVPWGVPPLTAPPRRPPGFTDGGPPFVLALGTIEPRKGLPALVEAFGRLAGDATASPDPGLALVLAGPDGPDRPAVDEAIDGLGRLRGARVRVLGPVGDGERRWLLEHAAVLAYPSITEGFGFPVLEAMTVGTPVVTTTAGALAEVAGDAALVVAPGDVGGLADALGRALGPERERLSVAGPTQASRFSWRATAEGLVGLYTRAATER